MTKEMFKVSAVWSCLIALIALLAGGVISHVWFIVEKGRFPVSQTEVLNWILGL